MTILLTRFIYMHLYLYLNQPKYQFLINKRKDVGIKQLNDPKAFIEYSSYMYYVYNDINY